MKSYTIMLNDYDAKPIYISLKADGWAWVEEKEEHYTRRDLCFFQNKKEVARFMSHAAFWSAEASVVTL